MKFNSDLPGASELKLKRSGLIINQPTPDPSYNSPIYSGARNIKGQPPLLSRYRSDIAQFWLVIARSLLSWIHAEHYSDVIMGTMASPITSLTIVCSTAYSSADQRKHQSLTSLAFVRGIHRSPVDSPHKGPVTRKVFPFDDVIMNVVMSPQPLYNHIYIYMNI